MRTLHAVLALFLAVVPAACGDDDDDGSGDPGPAGCQPACDEATEKCDEATKQCVARTASDLGIGDPCASDEDCTKASNAACLPLDSVVPGVRGTCVVGCAPANDTCPSGSRCLDLGGFGTCIRTCDAASAPVGCASDDYRCQNQGQCGRADYFCLDRFFENEARGRTQDACFPDCRVYAEQFGSDPCFCDTACHELTGLCVGAKGYGDLCYSPDDCAPGHLCGLQMAEDAAFYCHVPCQSGACPEIPGTRSECFGLQGGGDVCAFVCDAVEKDTQGICPTGHVCREVATATGAEYVCAPPPPAPAAYAEACRQVTFRKADGSPEWAACDTGSECIGLQGADAYATTYCAAACDPSDVASCPATPAGGQCLLTARDDSGQVTGGFCAFPCDASQFGTQGAPACPEDLWCRRVGGTGGDAFFCLPGCREPG